MAQSDVPKPSVSHDTQQLIKVISDLGGQLALLNTSTEWSQFDGTCPETFRRWTETVDGIYLEVNKNESVTLRSAARLLKGSAHDYFRSIANELTSWDHFKTLMLDKYKYLDDAATAQHQLLKFAQKSKETIPHYLERLQTLAKRAYHGKMDETNVTETITRAFISGILDRKMQGRIARRRPKDVDDAFKYAMDENRLTQELAMLTDHSKAIPEPMDCNAVTTPQASRELSEVKELLKELVLVQRDQFQVQPQHAPQTNYPPPHAPHTTPRYAPRAGPTRYAPHAGPPRQNGSPHAHQKYQWTADQRPICAFCGFVDHVHRVCRKKAATNGARPPPPPPQGTGRPTDRNQKPGNR